jgi:hypothetical protein
MAFPVSAFVLAATVAFICLAQKLAQLRRDPRNPSLRYLCVMLAALGVGILLNLGPVYTTIDAVLHVPNIARLFVHVLPLVAAASVQSVFLHLNGSDGVARRVVGRWVVFAVALILMGATFAAGDFPVEAPKDFAERYADVPVLRYYMLAFLGYLGLAMSDVFRMSMRYARQLPPSPLRLGIRLLTAGSLVGIAYVAQKGLYIAIMISGRTPPWSENVLSRYLPVLGIVLVAAGVAIAPITRIAQDTWHWPRRLRLHRRLHPLWQAIVDVDGDINLIPPRRLPLPGHVDVELYRRVIEIRDGLGDIGPYADAAIGAEAADRAEASGMPAAQIRAVVDAAVIAHAIDYLTTNPAGQRQSTPAGHTHSLDKATTDDYETDARWFVQVAQALTTSPIVADLRSRVRAPS